MAARTPRDWHGDLMVKLEAVHNLAIEADAFHNSFETLYSDTSWPSNGDPDRRRVLNRLGCLSTEVSKRIEALIRESREAVEFAMKRAR